MASTERRNWNDDRPTSYRAGIKLQISKRLANITIGTDTNGDDVRDDQIRRYEFYYTPKPSWNGDETLPVYSQLYAIQRYGQDGEPFPSATMFEYTQPDRGFDESTAVLWHWPSDKRGLDFQPVRWGTEDGLQTDLRDMNGDGFVDYVHALPTGELWGRVWTDPRWLSH